MDLFHTIPLIRTPGTKEIDKNERGLEFSYNLYMDPNKLLLGLRNECIQCPPKIATALIDSALNDCASGGPDIAVTCITI